MKKPHKLTLVASISTIIALLLLVISPKIAFITRAFTGDGTGTLADPYQITSCAGLQEIRDDLTANYIIMNDINCTGVDWVPIGSNPGDTLTGVLDGDGHTVSNISMVTSSGGNFAGFFGSIDGGTVKNLSISNIQISAPNYSMVGGLAGEVGLANSANSTITNVHVTGTISGNTEVGGLIGNAYRITDSISYSTTNVNVSGGLHTAGLIGMNYADVDNCSSAGTVTSTGDYAGGLIGYSLVSSGTEPVSEISNSSSSVDVESTGGRIGGLLGGTSMRVIASHATGNVDASGGEIGGLIGVVFDESTYGATDGMESLYATGNVIGDDTAVGGLIGSMYAQDISYSYATGSVTGYNGYVGGLIGYGNYSGIVDHCYATGNVHGENVSSNGMTGGLVADGRYISNSYATGNVTGNMNHVGGLAGILYYDASNSYATGSVVSNGDYAGGLIGGAYGSVNNCYATGSVTNTGDDNEGIGGLLGSAYGDVIEDSYATGNVSVSGTGASSMYAGGLVGEAYLGSQADNNYATGNVSAPGLTNVGGLIGYIPAGIVSQSYALGSVSGYDSVGGLIGTRYSDDTVNTYALGNVTATLKAGGLIGKLGNAVINSYSKGLVTGSETGGLIGYLDDEHGVYYSVTSSYYNSQTSGQSDSDKGTPITSAQMASQSTYTDWDFSTIWSLGIMVDSTVSPSEGGTISASGNLFSVPTFQNQVKALTLTATPSSSYSFTNWMENGSIVSSNNSYTFNYRNGELATRSFVANFASTYVPPVVPDAVSITNLNTSMSVIDTSSSLDATIPSETFKSAGRNIRLYFGSGLTKRVMANVVTDLTASRSWANVEGLLNLSSKKVLVHNLASAPGVAGKYDLYVPKGSNDNRVLVCPNAITLSAVTFGCADGYILTSNQMTSSVIAGSTYWVIRNLTGTGAMSYNYTPEEEPPVIPEEPEIVDDTEIPDNDVVPEDTTPVSQEEVKDVQDPEPNTTINDVIAVLSTFSRDVQKVVKELPISETASQNITAATLAVIIVSPAVSVGIGSSYTIAYVLKFFSMIFALFGFGRKKRNCGLVYNSVTKEPLKNAIVRIYNLENTLVATEVTNMYGIFETDMESGQYSILVQANNFKFPSMLISGIQDYPYNNVYKGGNFNYDSLSTISYSIPVDPLDQSNTEYIRAIARNRLVKWTSVLMNLFVLLGLVFSVISYIKLNSTLNLILLIVYIFLIVISIIIRRQEKYKFGTVVNMMEEPQQGVQVGLMEMEFNTIYAKRITNEKGKYRFIVPGGEYKVVSLDPNYDIDGKEIIINGKNKKILAISKNFSVVRRT